MNTHEMGLDQKRKTAFFYFPCEGTFSGTRSALNLLVPSRPEGTHQGLHGLQALEVSGDLPAEAQHPGVAGRGRGPHGGGAGQQQQQQQREQPGRHAAKGPPAAPGCCPFKQLLGGGPPRLHFLWGPAKARSTPSPPGRGHWTLSDLKAPLAERRGCPGRAGHPGCRAALCTDPLEVSLSAGALPKVAGPAAVRGRGQKEDKDG